MRNEWQWYLENGIQSIYTSLVRELHNSSKKMTFILGCDKMSMRSCGRFEFCHGWNALVQWTMHTWERDAHLTCWEAVTMHGSTIIRLAHRDHMHKAWKSLSISLWRINWECWLPNLRHQMEEVVPLRRHSKHMSIIFAWKIILLSYNDMFGFFFFPNQIVLHVIGEFQSKWLRLILMKPSC